MNYRYIPSNDPALTIALGWNPNLHTFFAEVFRHDEDGESRDGTLLHTGVMPRKITKPEGLIGLLAPYGTLSSDMIATLRADRRRATNIFFVAAVIAADLLTATRAATRVAKREFLFAMRVARKRRAYDNRPPIRRDDWREEDIPF
jgi:hypothetical protein